VTENQLAAAILEHAVPPAELAVRRIRARMAELEPLQAFGGALGAVYAAELHGLAYALDLLEDLPPA